MDERIQVVKEFYDKSALDEWERLNAHPIEFILTTYMMEKYIKPGDTILDIGGGPGRYSIHFAKMGCDTTLVDLSEGNIALAKQKAQEAGVSLRAQAANCLDLDTLGLGQYDHVFLMGPLYHLIDESQRVRAVELALKHAKPGGNLYASFIMTFAGIIYDLKTPDFICQDCADPSSAPLITAVETGTNYSGKAFTNACFMAQGLIEPFMSQFGMDKLHLFGQEGILAPNEKDVLARDEAERACWIDLAKRFLERPELLAYSEHAMYIGRKRAAIQ